MVDIEGENVLVNVLDHAQKLLAIDLELEDGVGAVVTHEGGHLDAVDGEVDVLDTGFVEHAGDLAVATQAAGCSLAELFALVRLDDGRGSSHVYLLEDM